MSPLSSLNFSCTLQMILLMSCRQNYDSIRHASEAEGHEKIKLKKYWVWIKTLCLEVTQPFYETHQKLNLLAAAQSCQQERLHSRNMGLKAISICLKDRERERERRRERQIVCNFECREKTDTNGMREEVHKMKLHACDCKCVQTEQRERVYKGRKIKREVQRRWWERGGGGLGDRYSWPHSLFKSTLGEISSLKCVWLVTQVHEPLKKSPSVQRCRLSVESHHQCNQAPYTPNTP